MPRPKPVVLVILDGWGYRAEREANAIALARTPNYTRLLREYPSTLVYTSGERVGLPGGLMGNSEVGHLNIGAGRIVYQEITRIDASIMRGEFFKQSLLVDLMARGRESRLHLLGLVSDGGVHSHHEHLYALLRMARENGVPDVFVHVFLDGRDTPPTKGVEYIAALEQKMRDYGVGRIATVSGRYYAMDRDNRWDRIQKAYDAIVNGEGRQARDPVTAVKESYNQGVTDEFVVPIVITDERGQTTATIRSGDWSSATSRRNSSSTSVALSVPPASSSSSMSPVLTSSAATPVRACLATTPTHRTTASAARRSASMAVPALSTRVISRRTSLPPAASPT